MKLTIDFDDESYHETIDCDYSISITNKGIFIAGKFTRQTLIEAISNAVASVYNSIKELDKTTERSNKDMLRYLSGVMYNAYSILTHTLEISHSTIEFEQNGETHLLDMNALMTQLIENQLSDFFKSLGEEELDDEDE